MLHAKDLMIRDWVLYNKKAIQVDNISADSINTEYCWNEILNTIPEEDVLPIPITPEILKKNGFFYSNRSYQIVGSGLYISWRKNRLTIKLVRDNKPSQNLHIDCHYLHELQHALRLCGIEKEIEL